MFFANLIINKNIIEIILNKVVKIFKENIVHVMLIIDRFIREIKRQCRRMNLAFILFTLVASLTVAFEIHILLPLHKS